MKRFEAVTVDKGDYGGWVEVRDTRRGYVVLVLQDYKVAALVADELNNVRPLWFASTFEGNVFFDVRYGPYASGKAVSLREVGQVGEALAVRMAIAAMEMDMHITLARYVAKA